MDSDIKRGLLFELPGKTEDDVPQILEELHRNLFFMKHSITDYYTRIISGKLFLECVQSDEKEDIEKLVSESMVKILTFDPALVMDECEQIKVILGIETTVKAYVFIGASADSGIYEIPVSTDTTINDLSTSPEVEPQTATETSV